MTRSLTAFLLTTSASFAGVPAFAQALVEAPASEENTQDSGSGAIQEIVVTAQKREQSVQRTPLAITAVSGDNMRVAGISNISALAASVPNLQMSQAYGAANVTIRGIGFLVSNIASESPVATHFDGVYFQRTTGILGSFFDVDRVEVLRGPQGTLYGRNATGGSINVITVDPSEDFKGFAQLIAGKYDHFGLEAAAGGPLLPNSDKVLFRIAAKFDERSGWGINEVTGHDIDNNNERAIRAKLEFRPTDTFRIKLTADYSRADDAQTTHFGGTSPTNAPPLGTVLLGGRVATRLRNVAAEVDPLRRNRFWGLSAQADYELGDYSLKSITAYRKTDTLASSEQDQTSAALASPLTLYEHAQQFSQEFQVSRRTNSYDLIVGGYYFQENLHGAVAIPVSNILLPAAFGVPIAREYLAQGYYSGSSLETRAFAAFGQLTYRMSERLSATVGARYSIERKQVVNQGAFDLFTPFNPLQLQSVPDQANLTVQCGRNLTTIGFANPADCHPSKTFKNFSPKIGLEFQATPKTLFYASISRGFKSGTYNFGTPFGAVDPEIITDYEIGTKSTFADGRLRTNLSGFYYDYKDLQVYKTLVATTFLENAASAKIYGIEAEITAKPINALQIDLSGSYLHSEFKDYISADPLRPAGEPGVFDNFGQPGFNLRGNRLPLAPKFSGKIGANYTVDSDIGSFTLGGEVIYTGKVFFSAFNTDVAASARERTRYNLTLSYKSAVVDGLYASLAARNITNKVVATGGATGSPLTGGVTNVYLEPPFTLDLTVGFRF